MLLNILPSTGQPPRTNNYLAQKPKASRRTSAHPGIQSLHFKFVQSPQGKKALPKGHRREGGEGSFLASQEPQSRESTSRGGKLGRRLQVPPLPQHTTEEAELGKVCLLTEELSPLGRAAQTLQWGPLAPSPAWQTPTCFPLQAGSQGWQI